MIKHQKNTTQRTTVYVYTQSLSLNHHCLRSDDTNSAQKLCPHMRQQHECRSVCTFCRHGCVCCVSWPLPRRGASLNCLASAASLADCRLLKNPLSCLPSAALCGSKHAQQRSVGLAGESGCYRGRHKKRIPRRISGRALQPDVAR